MEQSCRTCKLVSQCGLTTDVLFGCPYWEKETWEDEDEDN